MPRMKPRQAGPRKVRRAFTGAELLSIVASIAVDPRCPECGGPAELRPHPGPSEGALDLHIEHRNGCVGL